MRYKIILITSLLFNISISMAQNGIDYSISNSSQLNFKPSLKAQDLKTFARLHLNNVQPVIPVKTRIDLRNVIFKNNNMALYDLDREFPNPTIQDIYGEPFIQINNFGDFENRFRNTNLAFYEANRNSVISAGYLDQSCPVNF